MITEDWKEKAKEAWNNQQWNSFSNDLFDHLETTNPDATDEEIDKEINELRDELATQLPEGKTKDENPFVEFNKEVSKYFNWRDKKRAVNYEDLFVSGFDLDNVKVKTKVDSEREIEQVKHILSDLSDSGHPAVKDDAQKRDIDNNIDSLKKLLDKRKLKLEQARVKDTRKKIDLGWIEEIGNLPFGRWETRERIYDYWEGIHKKHDKVITAFDKFNKDANALLDDKKRNGEDDETLKEALSEVRELYQKKYLQGDIIIPNYVLKLNSFSMEIEEGLPLALKLIGKFMELKGISEDEDISGAEVEVAGKEDERLGENLEYEDKEPVDEDRPKFVETASMNPAVQEVVDETEKIKLTAKKTKALPVDPIFWYKYSDEYEDMPIPIGDLRKLRNLLIGGGEYRSLLSMMPIFKENQQLTDEFISKFNEWENNISMTRKKAPYHLPISPFIEDEYYARQQPKELLEFSTTVDEKSKLKDVLEVRQTSTKLPKDTGLFFQEFTRGKKGKKQRKAINQEYLDEVNEMTEDFLEVLTIFGKEIRDAFDVYNEKISEKDQGDSALGGTFGAIKQIASQGINRKLPAELTKSWNNLMDAMYEYYIEPLSGKFYVQAKERPRWSTGSAWLNLSKMVRDKQGQLVSPIGSLLEKGMDDIRKKDVEALIAFMRLATRGTLVDDESSLFKAARRASKALNEIFGQQFDKKNKVSVLNVIKGAMPTADIKNQTKAMQRFFGDLKPDKDRRGKNYPIDMLRHAINLPEFTAFFGISSYRAGAPKRDPDVFGEGGSDPRAEKKLTIGMDKDLYESLLRLDRLFDEFHKMDEINESLLYAHDTIRKMENKPIVKSYLSLTDVDQMGLVINKIHKEHRMDLTATEIDRIVKAVSSYESISRNYGINEEVVYTIKAMFR